MSHREASPTTRHTIGSALGRVRTRALTVGLVLLFALGWLTTGVLHGQGADPKGPGEALVIDDKGRVGIGTPSPQATLDVAGTTSLRGVLTLEGPVIVAGKADPVGRVSLQIKSGNSAAAHLGSQVTFGFSDTDHYRHAIRTRHNRSGGPGNAIDFYVWQLHPAAMHGVIGELHTMTLDNGMVGIGTTTPKFALDVVGATSLGGSLTVNGTVNAATVNAAESLSLRTRNVERMAIHENAIDFPNGWRIETSATQLVFHHGGKPIMALNEGERLQYAIPKLGFHYLGSAQDPHWAQWQAPSDRTLKTDIEPISSALEKVGRMRGVVYRWSGDARARFLRDMAPAALPASGPGEQARAAQERARIAEALARPQIGVIAQEVESVVPEIVGSNADGLKVVQYGHLAALLVEAVKEQRTLVQAQRTEIETLKASNVELRAEVHELQALRAATRSAGAELAAVRAELARLGAAVQRVTTIRAAARE